MTTVERIGRGLFFANLLTNAEKHGVRAPSQERMQRAWERHPEKRERWNKVAARILSEVPGIDLGTLTGPMEPFLMACGGEKARTEKAVNALTFFAWMAVAAVFGFLCGGVFTARIAAPWLFPL